MKKLMYFFAAAAAVLSGCSKARSVEELAPVDASAKSFYCTFVANETGKTTIERTSDALYSVYWEAGDQITVNNGSTDLTFSTDISGEGAVFTSSADESVVEAFFTNATGFTAKYGTDFSEGMDITVTDGNASHLPMQASASASERTLSFAVTNPVIAVKIPSNVSAKSLKLVRSSDSETVVSLRSTGNISVFYVPVPEAAAAQYNISAYSDSGHSNEIAESMKMQVAAEMTTGNIYPLEFIPTIEITSEGDKELLSYPAKYRIFIKNAITALNIKYADGAAEHPENVFINALDNEVSSLDINTADSHVEIENGNSANVTSKTSKSTFVIKPDYAINTKLTVEKGSVVVEGTGYSANVAMIEIPATATDILISINTLPDGTPQADQVLIENNAPSTEVKVIGEKDHEYYIDQKNPVTEVEPVATIGSVKYSSLADAFTAAKSGETVTLVANIDLKECTEVSVKDITLDLQSYNITYSGTTLDSGILLVRNGAGLTVTGTTGGIASGTNADAAIALTKQGDNEAYTAKLTVKGGNLCGKRYGIAGDVNRNNTAIYMEGGCVSATEGPAIFNPQNGTINVSGGVLQGTRGIYMKSCADVVATGGTIHGFGPSDAGDAIAVDNCSYSTDSPSLTIDGATLISDNASQVGAYFFAPETTIPIFSTNNSLTVPAGCFWKETLLPGMYSFVKIFVGGIATMNRENGDE